VGWNTVRTRGEARSLRGIRDESFFYFTHSYRAPVSDATVGTTEHGGEFTAVVERGNAFGVQFHPEKSGAAGLQLLRNFCEAPC
jgi:glutamine amidotransferase